MYHFTTFWRENSNTKNKNMDRNEDRNQKVKFARFARKFEKWDFFWQFSNIMKTRRALVSVRVVSWQDFCIKILRLSSQGFLKLKFSVSSRALRRLCLFASKQETASLKSCIFQYTLDLRIITLSKVCSLCRFASQDPKLMFSSFLSSFTNAFRLMLYLNANEFFCAELLFLAKALFS